MPVYEVEQRLPYPATAISVGAFFDRFGEAKLAVLADTTPLVQALIKDASVRKYIDLTRPDLAIGIGLLVSAGHATLDAGEILSLEIGEHERP